jgi:SPP1 gp7 family putative phage head morphogenesis protein
MSTNDDIQDALTRHQIFVQRYARGREKEAARAIKAAIRKGLERLKEIDQAGRAIAENNIQELNAYLIELGDEYADTFRNEIIEFGSYEVGVNQRVLEKAVNISLNSPAPAQLQQAIFTNIMSIEPAKGYTVGGLLEQFGRKNANKVYTIAQEALLLGKSNRELTQDIMNIIPTQQRKAETLARTITNHTSNVARNETMKENTDVVDAYKWVATLDSRTSLICGSRDGIVYELDDANPKPPAHFNCRSTISFVVNPEYDLGKRIKGTRPAKGDTKGRVNADLNYGDWLRRQSPEFQERVLGAERAKLFREGGVKLDRFVDDQGNVLTLKELRDDDDNFI